MANNLPFFPQIPKLLPTCTSYCPFKPPHNHHPIPTFPFSAPGRSPLLPASQEPFTGWLPAGFGQQAAPADQVEDIFDFLPLSWHHISGNSCFPWQPQLPPGSPSFMFSLSLRSSNNISPCSHALKIIMALGCG